MKKKYTVSVIAALLFGIILTSAVCFASEKPLDSWAENGHERLAHPFMLTDSTRLEALSKIGTEEPWKSMKEEALKLAETTVYRAGGTYSQRCIDVSDIVNYNGAAYVLDRENKARYISRILSAVNHFDPSTDNNIYDELYTVTGDNWNGSVRPGNAFVACVLALDVIYPDLTDSEIAKAEAVLQGVSDRFWNAYETHGVNTWGVRGVWSVYRQNWEQVRQCYNEWLYQYNDSFNADGGQLSSSQYALQRYGLSERTGKIMLPYILEYMGLVDDFYSNEKIRNSMEYLMGYTYTPNREFWSFGDTLFGDEYDPKVLLGAYVAPRYSKTAAQTGAFAVFGDYGPGTLFKLLLGNDDGSVAEPAAPKSRIFRETGAFLYEDYSKVNTLAGALFNQTQTARINGHSHRETNSLGIYAYGEMLIADSGYNYFGKGCDGYTWDYIQNRAVSSNTVLINYEPGNIKNPNTANNHTSQWWTYGDHYGGGITNGFSNELFAWAKGDSGNAIPNGKHNRTLAMIPSQDYVPGYFVVFDDVAVNKPGDVATVVLRPASDKYDIVSENEEYIWSVGRKTKNNAGLSVFMVNEPAEVEFADGVIAGDTSKGNQQHIKSILSKYSSEEGENIRAATILFPFDNNNTKGSMTRVSCDGGYGTKIILGKNVTDYVFTSDGGRCTYYMSDNGITHDIYDKLTFSGKNIIVRKNNGINSLYFAEDATELFTGEEGFSSQKAVSVFQKGESGKIEASADTKVTFKRFGITGVKYNGADLTPEKTGENFVTVVIPEGVGEITLVCDSDAAIENIFKSKTANGFYKYVTVIDTNASKAIHKNKVIDADTIIVNQKAYLARDIARDLYGTAEIEGEVKVYDSIYVPLREYAEKCGFSVDWHESGLVFTASLQYGFSFAKHQPNLGLAIRIFGVSPETSEVVKNDAIAKMIYVNGEPLANFDSYKFNTYALVHGDKFEVTCDSDFPVTVNKVSDLLTTITVTNDKYTSTYNVIKVETVNPSKKEGITVTASSEPQPENGVQNTLDGDLSTRWSANGDSWICFDFGEERSVEKIYLAWYLGTARISRFNIEVSNDNENWTMLYSGESSSMTELPEIVDTKPFTARYVRVNCFGTTAGTWNSITGAEFIFNEK